MQRDKISASEIAPRGRCPGAPIRDDERLDFGIGSGVRLSS